MKADLLVDAKGLACPLPIVRTKKGMDTLQSGQVLEVHVTDKGAKNDLSAWAKSAGHEMIDMAEEGDVLKFWIRKA